MNFKILLINSKKRSMPIKKIKNFRINIFGKPPVSLEFSPRRNDLW
jgi:hypothetical protein